ncbi:hypothetical protein AKJ50_01035 [candidate division MSBL1 archaeon SCGC-AAA382A13]|uniref:DUF2383 domain-containing protein n=1 Tax=candidate division MSBL1 archaeon SCGC-AAA382A13 TaxID=1698279 RepID=A0A133VG45_9EURY|nr:hypothetical protein AKJ50_01035 [candidate division MSBL1 archaeon SCGC-AAA382A13]
MEDIGHLADALKFGKILEEKAKDFYQNLSESEKIGGKAKDLLSKYVDEAEELKTFWEDKHRDCCRSDMDMGALEPISGIEPEDYEINTEIEAESSEALIKKAINAEKKVSDYYTAIGEKTNYVSVREMEKKAQKRKDRVSELESLL